MAKSVVVIVGKMNPSDPIILWATLCPLASCDNAGSKHMSNDVATNRRQVLETSSIFR